LITVPINSTDGSHAGAISCFVVEISSSFSALLRAPDAIRVPLIDLTVPAKRTWFLRAVFAISPAVSSFH
jgi:hypothetical protein